MLATRARRESQRPDYMGSLIALHGFIHFVHCGHVPLIKPSFREVYRGIGDCEFHLTALQEVKRLQRPTSFLSWLDRTAECSRCVTGMARRSRLVGSRRARSSAHSKVDCTVIKIYADAIALPGPWLQDSGKVDTLVKITHEDTAVTSRSRRPRDCCRPVV